MDNLGIIVLVIYAAIVSVVSVALFVKNRDMRDESLTYEMKITDLENKNLDLQKKVSSLTTSNKDLQNKLSSYKEKLSKISEMFSGGK